MKNATTQSSPVGNGSSKHIPEGTLRTKGCVIGHCAFVPWMESWTQHIELGPGPAQSYNMKSAIHALKEFGQQLLPLTQPVEALFQTFLPEEHSKYTPVYETFYDRKADNVDKAFGIWTSCSLLINPNTNNHKDLKDVCHGWCAIVVLGDFKGGDACFSKPGVKIDISLFFFFSLYNIFIVKVQEIAWSASYGENKTPNPKQTNKRNVHRYPTSRGAVPVPGPHAGTKIKLSKARKPS